MSDARPISTLADLTDRTVTGGTILATDFNSFINDVETRIAQLNDAIADLETHHAGAAAPTDNAVQGKLWYETDTKRLHLDPDGSGADQPLSVVLDSGVTLTGFTSRAGNVAGTFDSFNIPANTLYANGKIIRITCWGTKSGTNASAVIQFRMAATALASFTIAASATAWKVEVLYIRTAASTQDWVATCISAAASSLPPPALSACTAGWSASPAS